MDDFESRLRTISMRQLFAGYVQPLDAFSGFLMDPKSICGRGYAPNPAGELIAPQTLTW